MLRMIRFVSAALSTNSLPVRKSKSSLCRSNCSEVSNCVSAILFFLEIKANRTRTGGPVSLNSTAEDKDNFRTTKGLGHIASARECSSMCKVTKKQRYFSYIRTSFRGRPSDDEAERDDDGGGYGYFGFATRACQTAKRSEKTCYKARKNDRNCWKQTKEAVSLHCVFHSIRFKVNNMGIQRYPFFYVR